MKTLVIALLAGAAALSAGSARASDVYVSSEYASPDPVQQVRLVCDTDGNCYRGRSRTKVIVRDSYNYYQPRERYYERRTYHRHHDDTPRAGIGIHAPGVSVGVGVGSDRW